MFITEMINKMNLKILIFFFTFFKSDLNTNSLQSDKKYEK